ncbi:MAG TPA: carboxypeptidase-like regulatory domain-containing protein, partial [Bryobacteraceae bacterium]|nr:carboxypeptidase-like regulatory domain-containing protein [Bryobacteraceae bacterium]
LQNLAPGVYRLEGQRRDILAQAYEQKEGRMKDFVVGPSSNTERITFRLHPRGGIAGAVLDENGEPVEYADVALFRRTEDGNVRLSTQPPTPFARTDALGHFYFGYLESGSYLLAVKARPWYAEVCPVQVANAGPCTRGGPADVVYPITYSGSSTDETTAVSITVHEGVLANTRVILRAVPAAYPQFALPMHGSQQTSPEIELKASEFGTYTSGGLIYAPSAWTDDHLSIGGLAPGRYLVRLRNEPSCPGKTSIHVTGNQTFELNCKANAAQH